MFEFLAFIGSALSVFLLIRLTDLSSAIKDLKRYVGHLEKRIGDIELIRTLPKQEPKKQQEVEAKPATPATPTEQTTLPKVAPVIPVVPKPSPTPPIQKVPPTTVPNTPPSSIIPPHLQKDKEVPIYYPQQPRNIRQVPERAPSEFWQKLEKQLAENWTGILGAVIMVAGVIFLGIYAAIRLSAFNRFLLITAFAGLLTGIFIYLKRHEKWVKFGLWLRSSAGAVFLFGCLGSAGIPGLQWIYNPLYGMLILDLGIAVNILLGYLGGNQVYASLHVLLSLVALSIAPAANITLITAALVTLFGVSLTYREKWNYHLLLTISSFFAYHLYWFYQQHGITTEIKIVGIITIVTISVAVILAHYRKAYASTKFDMLPFSVHVINWIYFSRGLFLYSSGLKISTFFLAGGAIAAFFLARRAKKFGISWLYHTDTLIAQTIAVITLISLYNWHIDTMLICTAVFAQTMLFVTIMLIEKQDFLYKVGMVLANVAGFALLVYSLAFGIEDIVISSLYKHGFELFACFLIGTVFILRGAGKKQQDPAFIIIFGTLIAGFVLTFDFYLYLVGSTLSATLLFCAATIVYLGGKTMERMGMQWLYQLFALVAQTGVMSGLFLMHNQGADYMLITAIAFLEWIGFLVLMIFENDDLLYSIGIVALYLSTVTLIALSFLQLDFGDKTILYRHVGDLSFCLLSGTLFLFYGPKKKNPISGIFGAFGTFLGLIFISIYVHLYHHNWIEYPMVTIALAFLFMKEKWKSEEVGITALIAFIATHAILWYYLYESYTLVRPGELILHGLPLFILAGMGAKWSGYYKVYANWLGMYLFAISAVYLSYLIFNPVSSFIPGVVWLAMSPVALELAHFSGKRLTQAPKYKNQSDRFFLHIGFALIILFLVRHILVDLQSEQYIGHVIKIRLLIELFAFAIFIYWAASTSPPDSKYKSWRIFHPLFLELIIGFFILTVSVESTVYWYPIIWITSAFAMALLGNTRKPKVSRLTFYSLIMYWITAFQVAFVTCTSVTPSLHWYDQPSYSGSISILLQFVFLVYYYKKCRPGTALFPSAVGFLAETAGVIEKKRNYWIFFPLIVCTALFLFYSFDKSILTLLWVIECFLVFILSIILKEKYFRYVALGAIVLCVLRLIFYDLAQASALTRAFVFFGVGIIMLIMNALYNKYKGRFE